MTKQTKMALAMIGVFSVAMGVQGGAGYAASNGINGMRKIPAMFTLTKHNTIPT